MRKKRKGMYMGHVFHASIVDTQTNRLQCIANSSTTVSNIKHYLLFGHPLCINPMCWCQQFFNDKRTGFDEQGMHRKRHEGIFQVGNFFKVGT